MALRQPRKMRLCIWPDADSRIIADHLKREAVPDPFSSPTISHDAGAFKSRLSTGVSSINGRSNIVQESHGRLGQHADLRIGVLSAWRTPTLIMSGCAAAWARATRERGGTGTGGARTVPKPEDYARGIPVQPSLPDFSNLRSQSLHHKIRQRTLPPYHNSLTIYSASNLISVQFSS